MKAEKERAGEEFSTTESEASAHAYLAPLAVTCCLSFMHRCLHLTPLLTSPHVQLARVKAEKELVARRHDKEMDELRQRLRTAEANLDGAVAADEVRTMKSTYSRQIQELTVQISMMEEEVCAFCCHAFGEGGG